MKKLFFLITLLGLTGFVFAQNKKGNWLTSVSIGSAGYSFSDSKNSNSLTTTIFNSESNNFGIGISPTIGYYISDNVVIGAFLGIGYYSGKGENSNTGSTNTSESDYHYIYFSLGPYGRFYFGNNKGKGMPFAELSAGISFYPGYKGTSSSTGGSSYEYSYNNYHPWNAGIKFGYEHFINNVIGIQYYLGYNHSSYKYDIVYDYTSGPGSDFTGSYESDGGNINFGAGLVIHLDCSKKNKK